MVMRHKQRGMTFIGWLVLLALLGFLTLIALRLTPAYMEYYKVLSSVESVYDQSTPESTPGQLRADIGRRFIINNITSVNQRDIGVSRDQGELSLHVFYEYRTPMMGNVDAVVVFDKTFGEGD